MKVTTNATALSRQGFQVPDLLDLDITIEWTESGYVRSDLFGFNPDYKQWLLALRSLQESNELEDEEYF